MAEVYNPLEKINLGKSVADALLAGPAHPLGAVPPFEGAGIYVIYYTGPFPPYAPMADANRVEASWPIYIGKAIPSGGRKGASLSASARGNPLFKRLAEHRDSIAAVERGSGTLAVADFQARWLTVDDIWIPLGESLLITRFRPVWNIAIDGFGNHDPGAGRYGGLRPLWDHLHPGRDWACAAPRAERRSGTWRSGSRTTSPRIHWRMATSGDCLAGKPLGSLNDRPHPCDFWWESARPLWSSRKGLCSFVQVAGQGGSNACWLVENGLTAFRRRPV